MILTYRVLNPVYSVLIFVYGVNRFFYRWSFDSCRRGFDSSIYEVAILV